MLIGAQKAHMVARLGVLRLAASRLGYVPPTLVVVIGGMTVAPRVAGFSIRDELDGTPNTATLRVDGFIPMTGNEIQIYLGDRTPGRLIFAGHILEVTQVYDLIPAHLAYDLSCISYEWLLNRRTVTARYLSTSASVIAADLLARFTSGFSGAGIVAGLAVLDEISFTNEDMTDCLDRLASRIGGNWLIDYTKVLHLGIDIRPSDQPVQPITDADPHGLISIAIATDLSQVRTRVLVEGNGSQASTEVLPGETLIPVVDAVFFNVAGGTVTSGPQRITYAGVAQDLGGGALIGAVITPTNAPTLTRKTGAGLGTGVYLYAVTFTDATGETLPGPSGAITVGGAVTPPSSAPAAALVAGGSLGTGAYQWAYTFVDSVGGETTPSPAGSLSTVAALPTPSATMHYVGMAGSGGLTPGVPYAYVYTFTNAAGETLAGPKSPYFQMTAGAGAERLEVPTGPPGTTGRKVYRTGDVVGDLRLVKTIGDNTTTQFVDDVGDAGRGALEPSSNTTAYRQVTVTGIATSTDGAVVARKLYRTVVNGSTLKLVTTLANNTATTAGDNTADGALGATAPASNTATGNQVTLTGIAVGPVGTTGRKVYRTVVGGSQLKLLTTLANNTTTTHTDSAADGALGANVPTSNTSGLATATGQVNAGSTSIPVTAVGPFVASGGWAQVGGQLIRYAGTTATAITGIPVSGAGAITSTLNYGTEILAVPMLTGIPASGPGSIAVAMARGDEVQLLVTRNDVIAQTRMASLVGGDGIHEDFIQDRRLSETEAINRGDARLAEVKDPVVRVTYATRDQTTRSGWDVSIALTAPAVSGDFRIQRVTLVDFDARMITPPLRQVEASSRRFSFEALLRLIKGV